MRLRSVAPVTCRNTQEDVSVWYVSKHVCMYCRGWRWEPDCGDWCGKKKRVKGALGTENGKDTKVGGREVRLSRHLGFFGWMWQPLCCLIPPLHRHGWRIADERSIRHCWHHTAAHGGIDVCWQLWVSRWCYSEPWLGREGGREGGRGRSRWDEGLHWVALSEGSLKCHLRFEHRQIRRLFALQNFESWLLKWHTNQLSRFSEQHQTNHLASN